MNIHHYHHHHHYQHSVKDGASAHHEHHQLLWKPYEFFIAILGIVVVVSLTCAGLARAETAPNLSLSPPATQTHPANSH